MEKFRSFSRFLFINFHDIFRTFSKFHIFGGSKNFLIFSLNFHRFFQFSWNLFTTSYWYFIRSFWNFLIFHKLLSFFLNLFEFVNRLFFQWIINFSHFDHRFFIIYKTFSSNFLLSIIMKYFKSLAIYLGATKKYSKIHFFFESNRQDLIHTFHTNLKVFFFFFFRYVTWKFSRKFLIFRTILSFELTRNPWSVFGWKRKKGQPRNWNDFYTRNNPQSMWEQLFSSFFSTKSQLY